MHAKWQKTVFLMEKSQKKLEYHVFNLDILSMWFYAVTRTKQACHAKSWDT